MPTYVIDTPQVSQTLAAFDYLLVTPTGSLINTAGNAVFSTGFDRFLHIAVEGQVTAVGTAMYLEGTQGGAQIPGETTANDIQVSSIGRIAAIGPSAHGVHLWGTFNSINTSGEITASGSGVYVQGRSTTVLNNGTISASGSGINLTGVSSGNTSNVANTGLISSLATGIWAQDEGLNVNNSGVISGEVRGIGLLSQDVGEELTVTNTGTIVTPSLTAIWTGTPSGTGSNRVTNSGDIIGRITLNALDDVIINTGLIDGHVGTSLGDDTFNGLGGLVTGFIDLGSGDDTAYIDQTDVVIEGGADSDTLFIDADIRQATQFEDVRMLDGGGHLYADDDTATLVTGNAGDNVILGNGGNDTLRGRQGDDVLEGGDDNDVIIGNSGNDEIDGGIGADQLFGGRGADEIFGGFGNDTIAGGAGDDTISGGSAKDIVSGGGGMDVFLFESAADAGSGSSADRIDNFQRGLDVIDLVALGITPPALSARRPSAQAATWRCAIPSTPSATRLCVSTRTATAPRMRASWSARRLCWRPAISCSDLDRFHIRF